MVESMCRHSSLFFPSSTRSPTSCSPMPLSLPSPQPVADPKGMTATIVEALQRTGQRGVIQRGWGGLGESRSISWKLTRHTRVCLCACVRACVRELHAHVCMCDHVCERERARVCVYACVHACACVCELSVCLHDLRGGGRPAPLILGVFKLPVYLPNSVCCLPCVEVHLCGGILTKALSF